LWVGWLTTGVFAASAIGTGIAAVAADRRRNELENTSPGQPYDPAEQSNKADEARALAIATDVLIGAAAVSGIVTLAFTIDDALDDGEEGVGLRVGPTGASLVGSF
jgi:hypothetical protein